MRRLRTWAPAATKKVAAAGTFLGIGVLLLASCAPEQGTPEQRTPEQGAIELLFGSYWRPSSFEGGCVGFSFDPEKPVSVFTEGPAYSLLPMNVHGALDVDIVEIVNAGELKAFNAKGEQESVEIDVDLSRYPRVRNGERKAPLHEPGEYLVRFSTRLQFEERRFVELWLKEHWATNGIQILVEYTPTGEVVDHWVFLPCDRQG